MVVAPDGSVARLVPEGKPDPDYVGAARASLGCWEFFPATRAGQPVFGQVKMQINFEPRSKEFEFDATTFAILAGLRNSTAKIYSLKQIDELPKPTKQVQSCFPRDHEGPTSGEAVIECIIDTQGRPQLPRVIRASTPDFGWIAATTVAQWRFEPARKEGEAVASRVRIPIRIAAEPPAPSAAR